MAPVVARDTLVERIPISADDTLPPSRSHLTVDGGYLEAWAQGYHVGSLIILMLIVICNYRHGIWLHKLVLLELMLALWHGTFIFFSDPAYGWYLSSTAALLFISYQVHNVISWLKIRPFLPKWGSYFFIGTLIAVQPFWIAESWSNFEYFNDLGSTVNKQMRPWEALVRDPWWIFTTWMLMAIISKTYKFKVLDLVKISPRLGVMLACMFVSIAFLFTDVVINALHKSSLSGIDPYWRLSLVFKCASDTIFLDDFKSVLDDITAHKFQSVGGTVHRSSNIGGNRTHTTSRELNEARRPEVESIESHPVRGPVTNISSKSTGRPKFVNPFARCDRSVPMPKIHAQQETSMMAEMCKPRSNSYASDMEILPMPAPARYGARQQDARDSIDPHKDYE